MADQSSLKNRVDVLEQELASLKARIDGKPGSPWWIELFGACKDDPLFDEAMRLGADEVSVERGREFFQCLARCLVQARRRCNPCKSKMDAAYCGG